MGRLFLLLALCFVACSSKPSKPKRKDEVVLDAVKAALDKHAKEHGAFPVASADRTPADGCCTTQEGCGPAMFANLPWVDPAKLPAKLYMQLTYDSDGKTATVHALGNWDCDETYTDTELTGTIDGKAATWTVTQNAVQD